MRERDWELLTPHRLGAPASTHPASPGRRPSAQTQIAQQTPLTSRASCGVRTWPGHPFLLRLDEVQVTAVWRCPTTTQSHAPAIDQCQVANTIPKPTPILRYLQHGSSHTTIPPPRPSTTTACPPLPGAAAREHDFSMWPSRLTGRSPAKSPGWNGKKKRPGVRRDKTHHNKCDGGFGRVGDSCLALAWPRLDPVVSWWP